ncbi:unannotated protein [freshwater metagenome]|uniref:Unannotated protein n=1 Tax=freshwater metagenome TaxID=449393 RepID=A0A6J7GHR9_9ZZZZ
MAEYRVYLDPDPDPPLIVTECDAGGQHTPAPRGYLEWHEWATERENTHEQVQCACGLWAIWVPTAKAIRESGDGA